MLSSPIYRRTHQQTDDESASFVQKLESHIGSWTDQSNELKPHLKLHWLDGTDLGIPDDDIQAFRTSFGETDWDSVDKEIRVERKVFLAVANTSVASYMGNTYSAATHSVNAGDFTGFVLPVDAYYDPEGGADRPEESPGYHGQMRILGSLVWPDLYAQHATQTPCWRIYGRWLYTILTRCMSARLPHFECICGRGKMGCGMRCCGRWLSMSRGRLGRSLPALESYRVKQNFMHIFRG